ncbi:MAG: 2-oxoacid:acceptor oxidoreductase family protein [Candidatus Diapherotrites archaeon]|uniref:pyruvate synthase n=1 Tax=Candidatus Iainarchaeum sp. TaxID=3101447 RepID=A0A7J4KW50_9ARCH|nr:2-oxoacid:acceptor oxidoreductase family protein [Candidatus Diapherotrites archaeon]HIH21374.1 pyruvate ferredoxin oxidoreductase [Candidatus Diapherotrites archaeon]HIH32695.1 pyruvate ferredoxin oxidoreductase [Candidatus Diapherotrites archaeon]
MLEFRIHGRGGQGVQKSAQILGRAAFLQGFDTQDFSIYGAERQGAPLTSFVRLEKGCVATRGYVFSPDFIVILDDSIPREKTLAGKKESTIVLVNSQEKENGKNFYSIDATGIALQETGKAIANVAMLGALAKKLPGVITLESLEKALRVELGKYKEEVLQKNVNAARKCFEMV